MTIRDQGPMFQMGFGSMTRSPIDWNPNDKEGDNPESGFIAKKLHDHPVMRFLAIGAATVVGATVAGHLASKGGIQLGLKLSESEEPWIKSGIQGFRKIQGILDSWQGINRIISDETKLFIRGEGDKIIGDTTTQLKGFFFTKEENAASALYAKNAAGDTLTDWGIRREIQQRLVGQARRLPYELPAAYLVQRTIADKLLGVNNKPNNFHWYNPADVVSDFVTQSVKNTAFAIMPFEAGQATAQQGWRKLMMAGEDLTQNLHPGQQALQAASISLKTILGQFGADATDILQKTSRLSSQASGAFASGIQEAQSHTTGLMDYLHKTRHGLDAYWAGQTAQGINKTRRLWGSLQYLGQQDPAELLNTLPGPFGGIGSGLRKASSEWARIGQAQDVYQNFLREGSSFVAKASPAQKDLLYSALGRTGSPIQELADAVNTIKSGGKGSTFYKQQLQNEYSKVLGHRLQEQGVPQPIVQKFLSHASIQTPGPAGFDKELTKRINFGRGTIFAGNEQDFFQGLLARVQFMGGKKGAGSMAGLVDKLPGAMRFVDQQFQDQQYVRFIDAKINAQWNAWEQNILPTQARGLLKPLPVNYGDFSGSLSKEKRQFLRSRAAQSMGIKTIDDSGGPVSDALINTALGKRGIDPSNLNQVRAYLVTQGGMSKPWQFDGTNIFGFKAITLASAMQRGYLNTDPNIDQTLNNIVNGVNKLNPSQNQFGGGYKLGSLYQHSSGAVVDLSVFRKGLQSGLDRLSSDFQIPLVHLNPLSLFNYRGIQGLRSRSILQYAPSRSVQPFLRGASQESNDFYMWMRGGLRGSKGQVTAVGLDAEGAIKASALPGTYRPFPTIGESAISHHTKLAAGESGQAVLGNQEARSNWLRRILGGVRVDNLRSKFSFAADDSGSIFGYVKRFRQRAGDINNPLFMSRLLSGEDVAFKGSTYKLSGGEVLKDGASFKNQVEVASAMERLQYSLRPFGFPDRALRALAGKGISDYKFEGVPRTFSTGKDGVASIANLRTPTQIIEAARRVLSQDNSMTNLSSDVENLLRRARKGLIYRHLEDAGEEGYWNTQSGLAHKSSTIYSRTDELKTDLQKYLIIRSQALGVKSSSEYGGLINDLMSEASKLRMAKAMTQTEFTEFRTALLSLQVNYQSFKNYNPVASSLQDSMALVESLMSAGSPTKEAFASFGRGEVDLSSGKLGRVQPFLRRQFGIAPPSFDGGVHYNSFGDTPTVFVPTMGTAFKNNPIATLLSASGLKTWNSPEGFSGASIPMSHFIERLNKPFQFLGMGLDQGDFGGPLDFYARGLVGKRILPIVAGGAALLTADRTLGAYTNPKDQYGNRVYQPFFLGAAATGIAATQAGIAGIIPGGMSFNDRWDQLKNGEVPIREGRYWPLGNSPFMGGRTQYFRPSWYKRFMSGYMYTDQGYGTPAERLAFDYDFSPLRPLDPYRFERKHYLDRPYPVSGEYFTGPWGPLTTALNATVGRVLKPQKNMHTEALNQGLLNYAPVGEGGAYYTPALGGFGGGSGASGGAGGAGIALSGQNAAYAQAGAVSVASAATSTRSTISAANQYYSNAANIAVGGPGAYGIPSGTGMPPRIVGGQAPILPGSTKFQAGKFGYESQELLGIYGFMAGSTRQALGFGNQNFLPEKPMLATASTAYGSSRAFWNLNLGGTGDVPTPFEGNYSNLELSEILRRFIPKPRTGIQAINPIPNAMGIMNPWLPGADYFTDFKHGDPYTSVPEGEMRLPGAGYERLHPLHSDKYGQYGLVDRFKILGDVAPWSNEYHALDRQIDSYPMSSQSRSIVETTREQVAIKNQRHQFTPYQYKYETPQDMISHPVQSLIGKYWENIQHRNTYFNTKFLPVHTAVEDWERENVYGSTFPEWQHPIKDFVKPSLYTNTQRNPIAAATVLGAVGSLFGANAKGKMVGSAIGAIAGLGAGAYGDLYKVFTGNRYIPQVRKDQLALEENTDILSYVKDIHLYNQAMTEGNTSAANAYRQAAQMTMYGADVYNGNLNQIAMAMPDRKRDYFRAMLSAPTQERSQILSTAPRLERRIYEAAWGMPVEKRPDLVSYFENHELPNTGWEGWHPNTNMDQVKVKIGQSLGIDMSEMGYYPQQIQEANLVNPSYPDFSQTSNKKNVEAQLRLLLNQHNVSGYVQAIRTPYPGNRLEVHSGVG